MLILGKIEIAAKDLNKELEIAKKQYEKRPNRWAGNEALARILYLMKDPSAEMYLKKAIEYRDPSLEGDCLPGRELIGIGNYYRMLGDNESAQRFYQKSYDDYIRKIGNLTSDINIVELHGLSRVSFFLKRYQEVIKYGELAQADDPDPMLIANLLSTLSSAVESGDKTVIQAWLETTGARIQSIAGKGHFSATGSVDGLDLYEIVLEILREMEEAKSQ